MPTMTMLEGVQRSIFEAYNEDISELPFDRRPVRPAPLISQAVALSFAYAQFYVAGRQIYDVGPKMQSVLVGADYRDVPLSMLMLPFPSVYLHFGSQSFSIKGAPFEGAWVIEYQGTYQFYLCTRQHASYSRKTRFAWSAQYLYVPLETSGYPPDTPLGEIIEDAVRKEIETLAEQASRPQEKLNFDGVSVLDRRAEGSQEDLENFQIGIQSLDDAMRLVINSLIFITSYREHVHASWTPDTPAPLTETVEQSIKPKVRKDAQHKLLSGGYYKVNFVGSTLNYDGCDTETDDDGPGMIPHWRRSHWRRQRFGEGLKETRLMLIRKVLVNAHKLGPGEDPLGRITAL
ncbi:hypothetical protein WT83_29085 [Burkholderia territorii]|uniref:Uncharacterized protein n=2 Tax=Burkholderia territorii TaxID=1503055 RepID=A0A108E680_9BURK|nr:hypothetical protein WT83_29085 [Burkholderia territorii]